jgi:hypothetical protein
MNRLPIALGLALAATTSPALAQNASQWDFNAGDLAATYGPGRMDFWDSPNGGIPGQTQADTQFGTASSFGIGGIGTSDVHVMKIPPYFGTEALIVHHGAPANGGGVYTNQYTLIFDIYITSASMQASIGWFPFHNTNATNINDADAYIQFGFGIGIAGVYDGTFNADTWQRVAFAFDLVNGPTLNKYIDGVLVGSQILDDGLDGRWSMYCTNDPDADVEDTFTLFSEPEGIYDAEAYIKSVYFVDRTMTTAEIAALGAPDADGISPPPGPTCPCDFNGMNGLNSQDYFDFLTAFFNSDPSADFNHSGQVNSQDFFDFLTCFFDPPAGCK